MNKKTLIVGVAGIMAIAGTLTARQVLQKTSYTVARVIDGYTFETMEKQRVRLAGRKINFRKKIADPTLLRRQVVLYTGTGRKGRI